MFGWLNKLMGGKQSSGGAAGLAALLNGQGGPGGAENFAAMLNSMGAQGGTQLAGLFTKMNETGARNYGGFCNQATAAESEEFSCWLGEASPDEVQSVAVFFNKAGPKDVGQVLKLIRPKQAASRISKAVRESPQPSPAEPKVVAPNADDEVIHFRCQCGKLFKAAARSLGKRFRCTKCGQSLVISESKEGKATRKASVQPSPEKPAIGAGTTRTCRACGKEVVGDQEPTTCPHCGRAKPGWVHVSDKPKDPRVLQLLSAAGDRYARGQKREAIAEFLRAAELDPNEASIWSNIGAVYGELSEYEEAIRYLKKALNLDPNLGPAQRMLPQMEEAKAKLATPKPKQPPPPSPERAAHGSNRGSAAQHQCVKCSKGFVAEEGRLAPLMMALGGLMPGNLAQSVAHARGSGMKCNRCGTWICADCALNAAFAAGAGMLQHIDCGGMFENP
jgi:tetratricopeptide (TPR) repeat protein